MGPDGIPKYNPPHGAYAAQSLGLEFSNPHRVMVTLWILWELSGCIKGNLAVQPSLKLQLHHQLAFPVTVVCFSILSQGTKYHNSFNVTQDNSNNIVLWSNQISINFVHFHIWPINLCNSFFQNIDCIYGFLWWQPTMINIEYDLLCLTFSKISVGQEIYSIQISIQIFTGNNSKNTSANKTILLYP
jgi:hypothetical protein